METTTAMDCNYNNWIPYRNPYRLQDDSAPTQTTAAVDVVDLTMESAHDTVPATVSPLPNNSQQQAFPRANQRSKIGKKKPGKMWNSAALG